MFRAANNTLTQRFFKFQATNGTVATSVAGVQDDGSIGANTSALLRIVHAQSDGLLIKTEEPEVTLMDLPPGTTKMREFKCLGWMATGECSPDGPRNPQNDLNCSSLIPKQASGYCVVEDTSSNERFRVMKRTCAKSQGGAVFRCSDAPGFTNLRAEAQVSLTRAQEPGFALPNVETKSEGSSKGIVMVVYPTLIASAYATIRVLYGVLGCQLPIEVWYSSDEMRELPGALTPLQTIGQKNSAGNVTFREINTNGNPIRFEAKIFAIYNSGFDQVLFLDADNAPVRDPSFLFDTPEFVKMGAVFWPDYWHPENTMFHIDSESLVWELLDMSFVDMFEQESGQLLIDRRRHAAPLQLVAFYAFQQPNFFKLQRLAWGGKDLFRFAWLKLGGPFFMIQTPPAIAGTLSAWSLSSGRTFCGMTMVQHDTNGEVLFLHRNQRKLMGKLHPKLVEDLENSPSQNEDAFYRTMATPILKFGHICYTSAIRRHVHIILCMAKVVHQAFRIGNGAMVVLIWIGIHTSIVRRSLI